MPKNGHVLSFIHFPCCLSPVRSPCLWRWINLWPQGQLETFRNTPIPTGSSGLASCSVLLSFFESGKELRLTWLWPTPESTATPDHDPRGFVQIPHAWHWKKLLWKSNHPALKFLLLYAIPFVFFHTKSKILFFFNLFLLFLLWEWLNPGLCAWSACAHDLAELNP